MGEASDSAHDPPRLGGVPTVTSAQARAVQDALAAHGSSVDAVVAASADNAAKLLAGGLLEELSGKPAAETSVTVMAGTGHKGAVALGVAQRLAGGGSVVNVVLSRPVKEYTGPAKASLDVLDGSAKKVYTGYNERAFDQADLIIDGLIGAGLDGKPKASISLLIKGANFSMKPIVSLDVPTGLDATTGAPSTMTIKAKVTLALGLPKRGLTAASAGEYAGRVVLVDAGVPAAAWSAADVAVPALPLGRTLSP